MRHRSIKSRSRQLAIGAVLAGALGGVASFAQADLTLSLVPQGSTAISAAGNTVTMDIFATVLGANGSSDDEGLGGFFGGFYAAPSDAQASTGTLSLSIDNTYKPAGLTFTPGHYTVGSTDVVGPNVDPTSSAAITAASATDTDWAFASYLQTSPLSSINGSGGAGATAVTNGLKFHVGTLTFTAATVGSAGHDLNVGIFGRQSVQPDVISALWRQDGSVTTSPADPAAPFGVGAAVAITVSGPANIPGDIAGPGGVGPDGTVNSFDLNLILGNWGQTVPPGNAAADISGAGGTPDNNVNSFDLNVVLGHWGQSAPAPLAVPEPASLGLLSLAGLAGLRRRRS